MKRSETAHRDGKTRGVASHPPRESPAYPESYQHITAKHDEHIPNSPAARHLTATNNKHVPTPYIDHITIAGDDHVPTSPGKRASSYIPLTPHVLLEHNLHLGSSSQDVDPKYTQHVVSLQSLGVLLPSTLHPRINQDSISMAPTERFQASTSDAPPLNAYHVQMWPVSGTTVVYAPSQDYTYGESSIVANLGDENAVYAQDNSANTVVFAPDQQHGVSSSWCAYNIVDQGMDFTGIGNQFESCPYWDHTGSPWIMDNVLLEE